MCNVENSLVYGDNEFVGYIGFCKIQDVSVNGLAVFSNPHCVFQSIVNKATSTATHYLLRSKFSGREAFSYIDSRNPIKSDSAVYCSKIHKYQLYIKRLKANVLYLCGIEMHIFGADFWF